MTPHFGTVTIVGAGLLGASLGLALKSRGLADTVRGVGRRRESLECARERGAVDSIHLDLAEGVKGAGLVVVCTGAAAVCGQLDRIRPHLAPQAVVTDVASTKAAICAHAAADWPKPLRFVGSHPMAGSEKSGPEHAVAGLYAGACVIVCPEASDPEAVARVRSLWESVGAVVTQLDAETHDAVVARTSHAPHIAAACLAELAGGLGDVSALVGKGFRDATRIAAGHPEIWRDICLTNGPAIAEAMAAMEQRMAAVRRMVEAGDGPALEAFFRDAAAARARVLGS